MAYKFSIANFTKEFDKDEKGTGNVKVSGYVLLKVPESTVNYFNIPTYDPGATAGSDLDNAGFAALFREVGATSRSRTNIPGEEEDTTAVSIPKYYAFSAGSTAVKARTNSWQIPVEVTAGKYGVRSLAFPTFFTVGMSFQWLCTAIKAKQPAYLISPTGKRYPFYNPTGAWATGVATGLTIGAWCSTTPQAWSGSFADVARARAAQRMATSGGAVETSKGGG